MSDQQNKRDTGGAAFPTDSAHQNGPNIYHFEGMTLRDYFAGQALQGLLSARFDDDILTQARAVMGVGEDEASQSTADITMRACSTIAYGWAAAMISEKRRREAKQ
jgi:hypothetical protein